MIEIVRAEEKHVTAIGKLWWEFMIFHQNADHIFTPREGSLTGFEENQLRRLMKSKDGLVLVALDDGKVVGYTLSEIKDSSPGFRHEKIGFVHDAAVTASHRRNGIGQKMLTEIMAWFKARNIRHVELQTAARNAVANTFWQKQGFEIYMHTLYQEIK
jgi:ribosomal protein S18 acetylase RimI-like enzyme